MRIAHAGLRNIFFSLPLLALSVAYAANIADAPNSRRTPEPLAPPRLPESPPPHRGFGTTQPRPTPSQTYVSCGAILTQSVSLANDLDCEDTTGFALAIIGDGIAIRGNGHRISAPNASAGIFVQGSDDTVTGLRVNGVAQGYGLEGYDSPGIRVFANDFSGNEIGISLWAENTTMSGVSIVGNSAKNSSLFGIRTGQDGTGSIEYPRIWLNDFSAAGSFAMNIGASDYETEGLAMNLMTASAGGLYLKGGNFVVQDLSLAQARINGPEIFVDEAHQASLKNIDVSTTLSPTSAQRHVGLILYRVSQFTVSNLLSVSDDAGIQISTENGSASQGNVTGSLFVSNTLAGIAIVSFDGTPLGTVTLENDCFREQPPAFSSLVEPDTVVNLVSSGGCP